ncbi:LLM class flavin-dependent oxidoreductase [Nocardioides caldifontis]|uniref:LLM class flavin-dependent oxidoreductase n=1 Tax=Nocardioides caldifontis TaxID=2588938 RepID=UPI001396BFF5|nr:LLM class flavin-dependent oxidoreductase [Nocardioides caldifontis]
MQLGVHLSRYLVEGGPAGVPTALAALARAADEAGVAVLSVPDHVLQVPYVAPVGEPVLEGYSTLAFLAAHSERVELQLLDGSIGYRHPALLARTVATLDVLSGGRARLGTGAGWYEREHRALGAPFPPLRDRLELLDEALLLIRRIWSDDDGPWEGTHYPLPETVCTPRPLRRVPVMVSGVDERKALRLVARHADACSIFAGGGSGAEFVAGKLAALRAHCEREGTSYDAISRTVLWTDPVDDLAGFTTSMAELADVGVQEVHVVAAERPLQLVRRLGEVVPVLEAL